MLFGTSKACFSIFFLVLHVYSLHNVKKQWLNLLTHLPYFYQFEGFALFALIYVPNKNKSVILDTRLLSLTWVDRPGIVHVVSQHGSSQPSPPVVAVLGWAHLGTVRSVPIASCAELYQG